MQMPTPSDEQKRLSKLFTGTWRGEETIHPSDLDPQGGKAMGTWMVTPSLDGFALLVDYSEERGGEVSYRGHGVHAWDARDRCFYAFWFDNVGGVSKNGNKAVLEGNRYTYEMPSGTGRSRFTYVWETDCFRFSIERAKEDGSFSLFHEGSYTREVDVAVTA